ncbi:MAG: dipeptide epimerase [Candidatus Omnitrophica bacterium]|nr:dipeptide epimerase [Candidatus Omnitrophota bacterium]
MTVKNMIITKADVKVVKAPLVSPFRISSGQHDELQNVFLRIKLCSGVEGFGEAAVATHITGETVPVTLLNLKEASRALKGRDISDYRVICQEFRSFFKNNHAALAAFEMAVLDAWCRSQKMPLWKLFGKRAQRFSTDITIVIGTLKEAEEGVRDFYKRGFRVFKIKIGRDEGEDLLRVKAVARLAPRAKIILDANQAYDSRRMLEFLSMLRSVHIVPQLLEQPVPRDDWEGLAELTRESGILVCADESVKSLEDARKAVGLQAVSAINIKFMKSGILEAEEIVRFARSHGIKLMMGAMMESALSITAAAHFTAGLGDFDFVDLDTTFFIKGPFSRTPVIDKRGYFDVSKETSGIGLKIKM